MEVAFFIKLIKFLVALSILILVHEWGHFIAAVHNGIRVEVFSLGFGKKLFSRKRKNTEYCIRIIPLGGYVKLAGDNLEEASNKPDEFLSQPIYKRFWVVVAGPLMNYLIGIIAFWFVFSWGYTALGTKVGGLVEGLGAQKAGIQVNDKIVAVEAEQVNSWDTLVEKIKKYSAKKESIKITLIRNNLKQSLVVKLLPIEKQNIFGQRIVTRGIGIIPAQPAEDNRVFVRYSPFVACWISLKRTTEMTLLTYKALWFILTGRISARQSVGGPVAMFDWFAATSTLSEFLMLLGVVSVGLAIFNLLPFPALDGGHILLLGIEKIRGKYLSKRTEEIIARIGYSVLISLAILITFNDLVNRGMLKRIGDVYQKFYGYFQK
ncbi:MAG: RIP metalloprotease [Candidatus Omnitrophica bacterium]|nr:RIP metalloprotease [Candidatus Omnitrophota bacterium]